MYNNIPNGLNRLQRAVTSNDNFLLPQKRVFLTSSATTVLSKQTLLYAQRTALLCAITQRVVLQPYRHFRTAYSSHLQGHLQFLILGFGATRLSRNVGKKYRYKLRSPEERSSGPHRGGNLKSQNLWVAYLLGPRQKTASSCIRVHNCELRNCGNIAQLGLRYGLQIQYKHRKKRASR